MRSGHEVPEDRTAYLRARLHAGLITNWSQIAELDAGLHQSLSGAFAIGESYIPASKRTIWDHVWNGLQETLDAIHELDEETRRRVDASDGLDPLEPWVELIQREQALKEYLQSIRNIGVESLPLNDRSRWRDLCKAIEIRTGTLHAHALALRFQLELCRKYGAQGNQTITAGIKSRTSRKGQPARPRFTPASPSEGKDSERLEDLIATATETSTPEPGSA